MSIFKRQSFKESLIEENFAVTSFNTLIRPETNCIPVAPNYKKGSTFLFLPYPVFDINGHPKSGVEVLPDRVPNDPEELTDWVFFADGVLRLGDAQLSIVFDEPKFDSNYVSTRDNPVILLRKAAFNAKNLDIDTDYGSSSTDRWADLVQTTVKEDGSLEYAKLPKLQKIYFIPTLIFSSAGKEMLEVYGHMYGEGKDEPLPILVLNQFTMKNALYRAIMETDDNGELKFEQITGNCYVHFYNKKEGSCEAMRNERLNKKTAKKQGPFFKQQEDSLEGYAVYLSKTPHGLPNEEAPNRKEFAKISVVKMSPWERVIRPFTPEEAAHLIAERAGLPASLITYAWRDHPNYISETFKNRLKNKVTSFGNRTKQTSGSVAGTGNISQPKAFPPSSADGENLESVLGAETYQEVFESFMKKHAQSPKEKVSSQEDDDFSAGQDKEIGKFIKDSDIPY